jgi:hypothetical protein
MNASSQRRTGFTLVEMLVIMGIIGVLLGMILPALGGAQRRGAKAREVNHIRQVGVAWSLYANSNRDSALPGWIDHGGGDNLLDVQGPEGWKVRFRMPADLGTADSFGQVLPEDAQAWPWRLLPYLEFNSEVILEYLNLPDQGPMRMSDYDIGSRTDPDNLVRPLEIATRPAFGYNAFYVGGWWEMTLVEDDLRPRHRFYDAFSLPDDGSPPTQIRVVSTSPSSIRNSSRLVIFCSSALLSPGEHHRTIDTEYGAHYVVPPIYADEQMWGRSPTTQSDSVIYIESNTPVPVAAPIGRYTGQAALLHADLHTAPDVPGALVDQRRWIDAADAVDWKHLDP